MNINSLSLLDKMMQVTPQVMRMLRRLLERAVTRDDSEWAVVLARLTVSEKVKKIMPSRSQHKENERGCRTASSSATGIFDCSECFDEDSI